MGISVAEFVRKWQRVELTERSASQQHFLDLCELLDHPKPAEADPIGESFTFERGAAKTWRRRGLGRRLEARLLRLGVQGQAPGPRRGLRPAPEVPRGAGEPAAAGGVRHGPHRGSHQLHGHRDSWFTRSTSRSWASLATWRSSGRSSSTRSSSSPGATSEAITDEAAVAPRRDRPVASRTPASTRGTVARFLDRRRLLPVRRGHRPSAAEGLLPDRGDSPARSRARFLRQREQLFEAMATGGDFGAESIRHFNGNLFDDGEVLELTEDEIESLRAAAALDWSAVEPSVFGTLFERGLDPGEAVSSSAPTTPAAQDIETLVEPVVHAATSAGVGRNPSPRARTSWPPGKKFPTGDEKAPDQGRSRRRRLEAHILFRPFPPAPCRSSRCSTRPAARATSCTSRFRSSRTSRRKSSSGPWTRIWDGFFPQVGPWQLYGIEINPYAFELAQMTVWIGYPAVDAIQWIPA